MFGIVVGVVLVVLAVGAYFYFKPKSDSVIKDVVSGVENTVDQVKKDANS